MKFECPNCKKTGLADDVKLPMYVICPQCNTKFLINSEVQKDFKYISVYAGFWKRFAASIIDAIVLIIIYLFLYYVAPITPLAALALNKLDKPYLDLAGVVIGWLYCALTESYAEYQATIGKFVLGIKVTDLNGEPISFGRATWRHFGKILSVFIIFIGFLMIAFTKKKQGLHDIMAGCLVVNK